MGHAVADACLRISLDLLGRGVDLDVGACAVSGPFGQVQDPAELIAHFDLQPPVSDTSRIASTSPRTGSRASAASSVRRTCSGSAPFSVRPTESSSCTRFLVVVKSATKAWNSWNPSAARATQRALT
jgi:hypothetical protein